MNLTPEAEDTIGSCKRAACSPSPRLCLRTSKRCSYKCCYLLSVWSDLLFCSCPVVSNSLRPHGLQHARPLCPSPSPKVCPSSCPLYRWCHLALSSSDALFSFCPQSFPESGTFPMSQLFVRLPKYWSFSFNISPSNEYSGLSSLKIDWFDLHAIQGTFRSPSPQFESMNSLVLCLFYSLALKTVNDHWEDHSLGYTDLCQGSNISAFQHTV